MGVVTLTEVVTEGPEGVRWGAAIPLQASNSRKDVCSPVVTACVRYPSGPPPPPLIDIYIYIFFFWGGDC